MAGNIPVFANSLGAAGRSFLKVHTGPIARDLAVLLEVPRIFGYALAVARHTQPWTLRKRHRDGFRYDGHRRFQPQREAGLGKPNGPEDGRKRMRRMKEPQARISYGGITAISVQGYKSINTEQRIEIRPLTILAGANSSVKSSIMQPLLLLKQTLEAPFDPGPLLLDGPALKFTAVDQLLPRRDGHPGEGFKVALEAEGPRVSVSFKRADGEGLTIEHMEYGDTSLHPEMPEPEVLAALKRLVRGFDVERAHAGGETLRWTVVPYRCFLRFERRSQDGRMRAGKSITGSVTGSIVETIYVPGYRANRERTYPRAAVGETFPSTYESYTASIIERWQARDDPRLRQLEKDLEELGLTAKVAARPLGAGLELLVGRSGRARPARQDHLVNIADVGFGVSQVLPVLVAVLAAKPGNLVYLEEPELHLHPRAQSKLARMLAEAARREVRVVVETHSSLLLRGVQTLVARGELAPERVKLHWFKRTPQGVTTVLSADLDSEGAYGEEWPEDFDDVQLESEAAYLDAAEKHSA